MGVKLVLLGLSSVQRFITESRTTTDVVNASRIIQRLASTAARAVQQELAGLAEPYRLIYPVLESGPSVILKAGDTRHQIVGNGFSGR